MIRALTRPLVAALLSAGVFAGPRVAVAQAEPSAVAPARDESDVAVLEQLHRDSIGTRRLLASSVLIAGGVSVAGGAALMIPDGDDQAWRFAGINTAIFGAVNTVVGLLALNGIGAEETAWESAEARAARRTPEGLARAKIHAAIDERRESVGHAINLGLGGAYLGVAGTAVLASRLGVEHPDRWLASGIAIAFQSLFLVGVDYIGLARSRSYHRAFVDSLMPSFSVAPASHSPHSGRGAHVAQTEMHFGLGGRF